MLAYFDDDNKARHPGAKQVVGYQQKQRVAP
jgi:hypothetical protein